MEKNGNASDPSTKGGESRARVKLGVWQLAWPSILSNLLIATVGFADVKFVGALGPAAVAAVTTGSRVFFVLQAVLIAVTAGTTALVARAWGAGDREEAERVTHASVWICVGLAIVVSVPGFLFAGPLANLFRLETETVTLAASYLRWIALFAAAFAVQFALGTALRAAGDVRTPLWMGAVMNGLNIFLDYALIYGEFGFPRLGVAGAALASGLSYSFGALLALILWLKGKLILGVGSRGALERDRVLRVLHIGYPAGLEQTAWQGGFIVFLWLVAFYGTAPYAAYGIGVNILSFSFVVGLGFSIAAATLVGQHLGAGDPEGASRSGWRATGLAAVVMAIFGLAIILAAETIARFLISDVQVIEFAVFFIYVLGSVQILMAFEFSLGGALRGAGDTRFPLITVLTGLFGVRITLAAIFVWLKLPVEWVFGTLVADYLVKVTMLTARFRSGKWRTIISKVP